MWHMKRQGANILSYFSKTKRIELECEEEPDSDSDLKTIQSDETDRGLPTSLESQSSTKLITDITDSQ